MEYVLEDVKWAYIGILFYLSCVLFFVIDIKFKIYKIDMIQKAFGLSDNQCKSIATIFIILGLSMILFFYSAFASVKITSDKIILRYPMPRPSVVISNNLIERYEVRTPKVKENRGIMIYLSNGKKYKSTYVGPEDRDVFNKLTEQLNILINKNKLSRQPSNQKFSTMDK